MSDGILAGYNAFFDKKNTRRVLFWLILAIGIFARVYRFGQIPNGINQDEAFAGYEAWSLLKYGIDSGGYRFPVYLTAWGSGMNALESYLMIPFIAIFGLEVWAIRMPQVIVAILSLPALYGAVRRMVDERAGLFAMFMLAICPWHIILSRWGLESNLAPGFMLFGLYFFVRGVEDSRYLMLSALMYGLCLYTYATVWIFVPFVILAMAAYAAVYKRLRLDRYLVVSVLILGLLAAPLLAFLAVNCGYIDEIRLPFISIPKLLAMRVSEISLDEKAKKLELLREIFIDQTDRCIWNSPAKLGLFYRISMPFALFGLVFSLVRVIMRARRREYAPEALLLIQFIVCLPLCILVKANANRINIVILPVVIYSALGVYYLSTLSLRQVLAAVAAVYFVLFAGFESYYFTEYDMQTRAHFSYGLEAALDVACEKGETVYIDQNEFYTKVLFYAQTPVDVLRETGEYLFYPSSYLHPLSFDRFRFWVNPYEVDENAAYVMPTGGDLGVLPENGFTVEEYGGYIVAYKDRG